ncbi:hypothetical protein OH77DRAFT_1457602 [Trametes cingulata]|nr:hypothetical protein OH77DRAFT_1457602 [Trametes cingulata]
MSMSLALPAVRSDVAQPTPRIHLFNLDSDVLHCILEEMFRDKSLAPLSATCRSLRKVSLPVLFSFCEILLLRKPVNSYAFPPSTIWPYIQHVSLVDSCDPDECTTPLDGDESAAVELFVPGFLTEALSSMPGLTELSFYSPYPSLHNLPRSTINVILALPQLRRLNVRGILFDYGAKHLSLPESEMQSVPLTSFIYLQWDVRDPPRWHAGEQDVLTRVLNGSADSLQTLFLPNETAPLSLMRRSHWPNLRQLRLRGEVRPAYDEASIVPYVAALSGMPRLRSLFLELFLPHGSRVPAIWPPGYDAACSSPWPDLDSLTLSHPQVDDQLYRHLPSTMRQLALCCSPYHHHFVLGSLGKSRRDEWVDPLLTSSQMRSILRQCETPGLTHLTMQFFADHAEMDLLQYLSHAFPRLESLTVHIYRPECEHKDIPAEAIGRTLATLARLRALRMHLGFKGVPGREGYRGATLNYFRIPAHDVLEAAVDNAARILANVLPPSLETLDLFVPTEARPHEWAHYVLVRRDTPSRSVREKYWVKREVEVRVVRCRPLGRVIPRAALIRRLLQYEHGVLEVLEWC